MPKKMEILLMTDMTAGPRFLIQGRQVTPVLGGCWSVRGGRWATFPPLSSGWIIDPRIGNGVGDSTERR